ncbi:hypothetical protein [Sinomonas cellulolyticus]|nr:MULTISPECIES: hypothetical protein [Sinomonas]
MENKGLRMVFPIFLGVLIAVLVGYPSSTRSPRERSRWPSSTSA